MSGTSQKDGTEIFGGTSGWSYKDWVGPFYPEKTGRGFSQLGFYASFFDCVEVNSTFYRHFPPSVADKWLSEVENNPVFVFIIKLFNEFTHGNRERGAIFKDNKKIVGSFLKPFIEEDKLGGVLVQFSEYFRDSPVSREHISYLSDEFNELPLFFELRHTSWYTEKGTEFIREKDINVIAIDQPALKGMKEFDPGVIGSIGYVRLHGRNAEDWSLSRKSLAANKSAAESINTNRMDASSRYNYLYDRSELDDIEKKILRVKEKCKRIYVVANNHPMGKAVANALELVRRLRNQDRIKVPSTILRYFPELEKVAESVDVDPNGSLF